MPTVKFSDNPNEETAFVTQDGGQRNRAVLTAALDGTIKYSDNPNSTKVTVTVDGVERKAVAVVNIDGSGGGDQHNLGWYATESALTTAHATATDGDWAIVGATDTVWVWDSDSTGWKDTGAAGIELPDQTGHSGEFLMTDGSSASWSNKPLVNTATGNNSLTVGGIAATNSFVTNIGKGSNATANVSTVIGYNSSSTAGHGIAIGIDAKVTAQYAIQIGGDNKTNSDANTLKVGNANGNFELMSADGTIPTARLTKVNSTITLTAADWSSNTQTVTVTGMTATGVVLVSPDPTDQSAYTSAGIICTTQAADSLTFTCSTTPSADIDVVVVML